MNQRALFIRVATTLAASVLSTAAVLSTTAPAFAKQEYWDALSAGTGTCADCRLCHMGPVGNAATWDIAEPFTYNMIANSRLGTIPDAVVDSDMDGATDLVELQEFGDPNDPAVGPGQFECPTGPTPEYGCARVSPAAPSGNVWQFLAAALVSCLFIRRRR